MPDRDEHLEPLEALRDARDRDALIRALLRAAAAELSAPSVFSVHRDRELRLRTGQPDDEAPRHVVPAHSAVFGALEQGVTHIGPIAEAEPMAALLRDVIGSTERVVAVPLRTGARMVLVLVGVPRESSAASRRQLELVRRAAEHALLRILESGRARGRDPALWIDATAIRTSRDRDAIVAALSRAAAHVLREPTIYSVRDGVIRGHAVLIDGDIDLERPRARHIERADASRAWHAIGQGEPKIGPLPPTDPFAAYHDPDAKGLRVALAPVILRRRPVLLLAGVLRPGVDDASADRALRHLSDEAARALAGVIVTKRAPSEETDASPPPRVAPEPPTTEMTAGLVAAALVTILLIGGALLFRDELRSTFARLGQFWEEVTTSAPIPPSDDISESSSRR